MHKAGWWASNIVGGVVRWITATIVAAICIVLSFSPAQWLADHILRPPDWLVHPLTRLAIITFGVVAIVAILLVRRRSPSKTATENPSVHYNIVGNTIHLHYYGPVSTGLRVLASIIFTMPELKIADASNISSLTDLPSGEILLTFAKGLPAGYAVNVTADKTYAWSVEHQSDTSCRLKIQSPEAMRVRVTFEKPVGALAAPPSLPTWFELEKRFRVLEPALQFSRIDGQTGAAGEYWRIAGGAGRDAEARFNAVAALASARLLQDFADEVGRHEDLALENDPSIRWYKALQYIGDRYEHRRTMEQVNDDGSSGGFLYTGTIDKPAAASATLCLALAARATKPN